MGCVQSLFNPSKSRTPSPEREFEPPTFETVPVTRQPKKTYNTSATGISVADDRKHSDAEYDSDSGEMNDKCDDFERYALDIEDDLHSVHYVEATALTTLAANSSTVAILGTTAKCKSAGSSPAIRRQRSSSPVIRRQRSSSPSPSASSSSLGPRPMLVGSVSQPMLESRCVKATPVRRLAADTGTIVVVSSSSEREAQHLWLSEAQWADHLAAKERRKAARLAEENGPPPPSPSPFSTSSPQWPLKWPADSGSGQSDLSRIPVGVIEVLDCEPADQRRPTPPKAQRFPRAQRATRDQNIPLPVIHAMEMKPNALNHEDLFKTMTVQPPSSDKHGYRSRIATGSSTFDSSSRKPFLRQSNESKYTEKEFSAATEWMSNMPVFAKCPPAKSKSLPYRDSVPSSTSTAEVKTVDRQHGVIRGSSLPYDSSSVENSSKSTKRSADKKIAVMVPVALESAAVVPGVVDKPANQTKKSDMNDKPDENHKPDEIMKTNKIDESDVSEELNSNKPDKPDNKDKEPDGDVQSNAKAEKVLENTPVVNRTNGNDVEEEAPRNQADGGAEINNSSDSKDHAPLELDTEYRLTMIHSVREAVNRICEQAVEKTAAIVRNRCAIKRYSNGALTNSLKDRDADNSEAADNVSSEFSLPPPPPPQQQQSDTGSIGLESSWPPPPTLSEAEEERTIAPGHSFDLPDPPTEMDQMDSETDKLDISDEEMKATGLPSDDDDKTDTEAGDGVAENDRHGNDIDVVMKSTASGGSPDGSVEAAMVVAQDTGADDRAATTIQAVYRGFRARKYVETVNAAAVKIQAGFRGYRVRQSLKNAAPSTATTTTDESQCWSDDDQKSVVSVTYAPLKEYECEPRGAGDGRGDGDDDSDAGGNPPSSGVVVGDDSVSGVSGGVGGGVGDDGDGGNGDGDGRSGFGSTVGGHVGAGVGVYEDDDDDDDQLQTGDDEVFERDENDIGGGDGHPATNTTSTLSEPAGLTEVSAPEDAAEAEALVQAAVKIQARVRGFAARKRLNEEKKDDAGKQ